MVLENENAICNLETNEKGKGEEMNLRKFFKDKNFEYHLMGGWEVNEFYEVYLNFRAENSVGRFEFRARVEDWNVFPENYSEIAWNICEYIRKDQKFDDYLKKNLAEIRYLDGEVWTGPLSIYNQENGIGTARDVNITFDENEWKLVVDNEGYI